jgi:hypothetical protein
MRAKGLAAALLCACNTGVTGLTPGLSDGGTGGTDASAGTETASTTVDDSAASASQTDSTTQDDSTPTGEPASSSDATSVADTESSGASTDTTTGDTTGDTTGAVCEQLDTEPNDDEDSPVAGPDTSCNNDSQSVDGTLADGADVDWFQFNNLWNQGGCTGEAQVDLTVNPALEVCLFVECTVAGSLSRSCDTGTPAASDNGRLGCCGSEQIELGYDCGAPNGNNQASMFVAVEGATQCTDYMVSWTSTYDD